MGKRTAPALLVVVVAAGLIAGSLPGHSARTAIVASPAASPAASPTGGSVSVADSVTIRVNDWGFDPGYVEATNGHDLTVTLVNAGTRRHAFRLDGYRVDVSLVPGQATTIAIHAPSLGDFPYHSDAPGDAGMTGQLTFYI